MSGIFHLKRSGSEYMFNLKAAGNGEVVMTSEMYAAKLGALNGIASVKVNAPMDGRYRRLTARDGSPYFTLQGANAEIIGVSEMYSSTTSRDKGVEWVKANAPSATTADYT